MVKASERQVNGDHYKDMAIQPAEFIYKNNLNWYEANAVKYICRHRRKGGRVDLEKVKHYIDLLIEAEYANTEMPPVFTDGRGSIPFNVQPPLTVTCASTPVHNIVKVVEGGGDTWD